MIGSFVSRLFVNEIDTGLNTPVEGHVLRSGQTYKVNLTLPDATPKFSQAGGLEQAFQGELMSRLQSGLVDRRIKPLAGGKVSNRISAPKFSEVVVAFLPNEPPRWESTTDCIKKMVDAYSAGAIIAIMAAYGLIKNLSVNC